MPSPKIRRFLLPLSWLYGMVVWIRNRLFDRQVLKQHKFDVPIICTGNITVGGTGKTPHAEYLVRLLSEKYKVAVLSRGYKRKTKGFRMVQADSLPEEVGDEPLQIKRKFPDVSVIVDKDRKSAIERMLSSDDKPEVILLDDGFQHRHVKPSLSILLVDSNRPVYEDMLLPAGNLREPLRGKDRASIIIVTKCSDEMQPIDFRIYEEGLDLFAYQRLYFTTFDYGKLVPLFPEYHSGKLDLNDLNDKQIYLVTGIAQPQPLKEKLKQFSGNIHTNFFPDHHFFNQEDIANISKDVRNMNVDEDKKIVITTEKDAVRLRSFSSMDEELKRKIYYIPVEVAFVKEKDQESFNKKIIKHVRNYQTNSRLPER